jgi:hypothetical protein
LIGVPKASADPVPALIPVQIQGKAQGLVLKPAKAIS